ncbi:MAG: ABC transporter ATP-binding protein [Leptospiraceae bacterium]|nr:ABC transporter ATP-binding protein [Leptospiraceae bacterium]MCP5485965.1 ABC transporter ATP-binding protein [Spirochaetales bacterium]
MIQTRNLGRDYSQGTRTLSVLSDITLEIGAGEFVAVTGPSGSGKSTLLALLAGLDRPSHGQIWLAGKEITGLNEDTLSAIRADHVGFIFQSFQLIPTLTAIENVRVPADIAGDNVAAKRAHELLERVGLADRAAHYPSQLSGGEMQRVAIARAAIRRPSILFADEPTGNLDSSNGEVIMNMLRDLNQNCTLVLVTHNPELAGLAGREIKLRDGRIDQIVNNQTNSLLSALWKWIQ